MKLHNPPKFTSDCGEVPHEMRGKRGDVLFESKEKDQIIPFKGYGGTLANFRVGKKEVFFSLKKWAATGEEKEGVRDGFLHSPGLEMLVPPLFQNLKEGFDRDSHL